LNKHISIIQTVHLFPKLDALLLNLLKSIDEKDWNLPTFAGYWTVKDVAAHLLDGNLRPLSMLRDGFFGVSPKENNSYQSLLEYLNKLNQDWVNVMKRLSPKVLIELLEHSGTEYIHFIENLKPNDKAVFSVAWAGESESLNWFHIAREYTEKWHHQQQIRYALGCPEPLYEPKFYLPYLETSMRALPHHYRNVVAEIGESIEFVVSEMGAWTILNQPNGWQIVNEQHRSKPSTQVIIPKKMAWKILTKATRHSEAEVEIEVLGKAVHGKHFLQMLAVMA
jgi:hypothetical protein